MHKKSKKLIISLLLIVCLFSTAVPVLAQTQFGMEYASALNLGTRDLRATAMQVINILLGFLGIIFIGILLYGGYMYMTSAGAADKVERAKKILINGSIGLALILSSYAIAFFVINLLTNATGGGFVIAPGPPIPPLPPIGQSFAVSWVDPADAEANVSLCRLIQMKFNNQINPTTIVAPPAPWGGSFTVDDTTALGAVNLQVEVNGGLLAGNVCATNDQCASGVCSGTCQGDLVPGEITMWPNARGLTYNNTNDFEINTTYKVTIKSDAVAPNGLENTSGSRLALGDYTWTFTTGAVTDTVPPTVVNVFPLDATTDVCLETTVTTIFSEPMDVSSLLSTDPATPMNPNTTNSIYMEAPNTISGFNKSTSGSTTLITKPKQPLAINTPYTPILDSDVIRDSCGNYLDGNTNGVEEFSPADDYAPPPVGGAPDWSFTTGTTAQCTPEITSIVPATGYYNDENAADADLLTINGNYFTIAGSVFFNNNVEVLSAGTNYCIDPASDPNYVPTENCVVSWNDNQIQVRIPASNGASNGAITGDVVVEVGAGNTSNANPFTVASPHIEAVWPKEGGIDQFVTLSGSGFGAVQGASHVYFRRDENTDTIIDVTDPNEIFEANLPCPGSVGWSDTQIIISVPDNINFDPDEDWYIQVVVDEGGGNYWGNLGDFKFIDVVPGPGICSVTNIEAGSIYNGSAEGMLDETVQFSGVRFQDVNAPVEQEVNFGNYASSVPAKNVVNWVYAPPDLVDADVPNISAGVVGAFLKIDGKNSNTLNFTIHPTDAGPKINYFDPLSGAVGEYVTIYGNDFGNWDGGIAAGGNCNVEFGLASPPVVVKSGDQTFSRDPVQALPSPPAPSQCYVESVGNYLGRCSNFTFTYSFDFPQTGNYILNVETTNYGSGAVGALDTFSGEPFCPANGIQHHVRVLVGGVYKGDFCNDAWPDGDIKTATVDLGTIIATGLPQTITLNWDNDWSRNPDGVWTTGDESDSNVRIHDISLIPTNIISADFNFPEACGNNFWSDTQIVAKVPAGVTSGNIKVTTRENLSDDTSDLSPSNFIVNAGPAGPGICNISPKSGPIGTVVNFFGERFTGADGTIFFNNKDGLNFNFIDDENVSAVAPNKTTPVATDDAVSGPIIIVDDKNTDGDYNDTGEKSNGYDFNVFDCRSTSSSCADIGFSGYECCYDGSCADPAAGGCNNPSEATYSWNFSTGTYTSCSGYSMNQCLASKNCPNSPGQCSASQAQTNVDTGSDCGDAYCNNNFDQCKFTPDCVYNNTKNICELDAAVCNINSAIAKTDHRVGYWNLEGPVGVSADGATLADLSSNGNNGTGNDGLNNTGLIHKNARYGAGIEFDGIDDYVEVADNPSLDTTKELTVEAWIYPTGAPGGVPAGGGRTVASRMKYNGLTNPRTGWNLGQDWYDVTVYNSFDFRVDEGVGPVNTQGNHTTVKIPNFWTNHLNEWSHIVGVYKPSQYVRIYRNGIMVDENTTNVIPSIAYQVPLIIGARANKTQANFKGIIDEVTIYDRALSDSEILASYFSGNKDQINLTCREKTWGNYPRVGYWDFNEKDETLPDVYDSSGNGNDGMRVGNTTRVNGRFDGALDFSGGANDYVDVGNDPSLDITGEITLEAWINSDNVNINYQMIVGKYPSLGNGRYMLRFDAITGKPQITLYFTDGTISTSGSDVLSNNQWYHLVGTYDNSAVRIYVNGVEKGSTPAANKTIISGVGEHVLIGKDPWLNFDGLIDEVAIYNRALSPNEVMARYVSGNKDNVWQYPIGGGCIAGSFQDTNGYCTAGSISAPLLCAGCQDGFSCSATSEGNGVCVINQTICPSGSKCVADIDSDGLDDCAGDIPGTCECCCRVGYSDTDCCAGLTCEDDACGTDDATYSYGHCKGCAVWDSGNFFQTLSDDSCGCVNSNRICITDELKALPKDIGSCGDCSDINSIIYDSDNSGAFASPADIEHECKSHGSCCWNSLANSCYTCNTLEVVEEVCSPASSPSPQKEETEACLNSIVYAKFNLKIDPSTLSGGIEVYECTDGKSCAVPVSVVPAAGYPRLTGAGNELEFVPVGGLFNSDTWYKVIINRNLRDLNSLSLNNNYQWYFKTKDGTNLCAIDNITVAPKDEIITIAFDTRVYTATPIADCMALNPLTYNWSWSSSDTNIAAIPIPNADIAPPDGLFDPVQTVTAQDKDGSTKIIAGIPAENIEGEADLFVLLEDPKVVDHWPDCDEACLNASLGAEFNMAMDPATLTIVPANIQLQEWRCGNGEIEIGEDCDDGNAISGDGCSENCLKEGTGLISYWAFDEGSGADTYDIAGNNDGKAFNTPAWTTGKFSEALDFDWTNSEYVEINNDAALFPDKEISISAWVYRKSITGDYEAIVSTGWSANDGYYLGFTPAGDKIHFSFKITGCGQFGANLPVYAFNNNEWYHITGTYNNSNDEFKVYINGDLIGSDVNVCGFPMNQNAEPIYIGRNSVDDYFDGIIDDVRIYNKVLTDAEVKEIMEKSYPCGDGTLQSNEECDGDPFPKGCGVGSCLHTGFVASVSTCGDGNIGEGEDCDDGNFADGDGCSSICLNEGTNEFTPVVLGNISPSAGNTIIDISLPAGNYFNPDTYYRTFLFDGIRGNLNQKQLSELNWDFDKDGENDSFSWSFKTKNTFCNPDTVKVDPEQKVLYNINTTQDYEASIYGSPDSCNPRGQKLNPYSYNWSWFSTAPQIADFIAPFPANRWPSCGNEKIELGEDCDDGNIANSDGCSDICLNEGATTDMGLVSHWEFEEGANIFAYDSAGVNDGDLINDPTWTTGKFGGALDFDRTKSQYVDVGNIFVAPQTELTVSAWVFVDEFNQSFLPDTGTSTPIVSNWNTWAPGNPAAIPPTPPTQKGFLLRTYSTNGNLLWNFIICDGANYYTVTYDLLSNNNFNTKYAGKWLHIAGTYKPGASNLKLYIDGINVNSLLGLGPASMVPEPTSTRIGYTGINSNYLNGKIDDVRIYDKSLTGAQIQGIMSQKNYLCGNGVIDFGEDCDGSPFPAGCDINSCLHTGSLGVCGNGIIETGEDCDDGNVANLNGCSSVCLHEGTQIDPYIDFYQTATTKSPGKTNIEASVNYCGDDPAETCGGTLPACTTGACNQTTGSGDLEVVCGFSNDDSCSQGVCSGGFCTNNSNIPCTVPTEANDCDLTVVANTTCNFQGISHICPTATWGGTCSTSGDLCYSASDCLDSESCSPHTDCNYCANNTSFECRAVNDLAPGLGNTDCQLGVGYDSCCYSRPIVKSESPDPNSFNPLLNPLALDCNNNATPSSADDYCSAFGAGVAPCQTYSCQDTNSDSNPDTCSAYGRCSNRDGLVGYWRFDELHAVNGNTIFDSSSSSNNGILSANDAAEKTTIGKISGALKFDGSSDYVDLPDGLSNFTNGFSVSVWAYPTFVQNWQRFIDIGNGSGVENILFTRGGISNNLILDTYNGAGFGRLTAVGAIELNKWQLFSATINNVGDAKIYKNGLLIASGPVVVPKNIVRTKNYIGRSNFVGDGYYQGLMDDVRIYNRTLTPEEIANLFNSHCLNNNDCPAGSICDKTCRDDSQCNGITCGACRNAQINITFDKLMDPASFTSEGVCSNNSTQSCTQDSNCPDGVCLKNIRLGVRYDDAAINQKNCPTGYYAENDLVYEPPKGLIAKFVAKVKGWVNKLLGRKETIAAEYWCAIPGTITSFNNKRTTAVFAPKGLKDNLFEDGVTYRVTVKNSVKRIEGVSMGKDDSSDFQYEFTAGDIECQVETVDVYVGD